MGCEMIEHRCHFRPQRQHLLFPMRQGRSAPRRELISAQGPEKRRQPLAIILQCSDRHHAGRNPRAAITLVQHMLVKFVCGRKWRIGPQGAVVEKPLPALDERRPDAERINDKIERRRRAAASEHKTHFGAIVVNARYVMPVVEARASFARGRVQHVEQGRAMNRYAEHIGPKRITFLHYIIDLPGAETLGTDIYEDDEAHTHFGSSPAAFNQALVFVPAKNTWHGFEQRPIPGIRKSLIINYVGPEWRNRQELAFPDQPV